MRRSSGRPGSRRALRPERPPTGPAGRAGRRLRLPAIAPAGVSGAGADGSALRRNPVTTRAAVLGLVVCVVVLTLAYPLREFLAQRSTLAQTAAQQTAQQARVAALQHDVAKYSNPSYIELQARERLDYRRPGEVVYLLAPAHKAASKASTGSALRRRTPVAVAPNRSWYGRLYRSTVAVGSGR